MLGALIMVHGDDRGLRLPPRMAPVEIAVVPIIKAGSDDVTLAARELHRSLKAAGFRVKLDERDLRPGNKFADWEMRGVPLRIEMGANDLAQGVATLVRRDKKRGDDGAKTAVPLAEVPQRAREMLEAIQQGLFDEAAAHLKAHTFAPNDRAEFVRLLTERAGMVDIAWCERAECEAFIKVETSATSRNLRPLEGGPTACVACGEPARVRAYFAQAY